MKKTVKKTKKTVLPEKEPDPLVWDIKKRVVEKNEKKKAIFNNKQNLTELDYSFPNKQIITPGDVLELSGMLSTKYGANNIMIRALNNTQWFSLKGFNKDLLNFEDYDDYYDGRVNDTSQFTFFYQLQVSILH